MISHISTPALKHVHPDSAVFPIRDINPNYNVWCSWERLGNKWFALWVGPNRLNLKYRVQLPYFLYDKYICKYGSFHFWDFILTSTQKEVDLMTLTFKMEGE